MTLRNQENLDDFWEIYLIKILKIRRPQKKVRGPRVEKKVVDFCNKKSFCGVGGGVEKYFFTKHFEKKSKKRKNEKLFFEK